MRTLVAVTVIYLAVGAGTTASIYTTMFEQASDLSVRMTLARPWRMVGDMLLCTVGWLPLFAVGLWRRWR